MRLLEDVGAVKIEVANLNKILNEAVTTLDGNNTGWKPKHKSMGGWTGWAE